MKRIIWGALFIALTMLISGGSVYAESFTLRPSKVAVISSPEDGRDTRVLVYFNLPEKLSQADIEVDFAMLEYEAQVTDAYMGQIEVYPVTTSWKDRGAVSWKDLWDREGGDYTMERAGTSVTIKSEQGKEKLRSNVTYVVKSWLDGLLENHGLIIVPSQADLMNSPVIYSMETGTIELKIVYISYP